MEQQKPRKNRAVQDIPLGDITPYQRNAKKHPDKQVQNIANSIQEFGFTNPLLVDENNVIIAGHGRYEAAKLLKLETVPVLVVSGLTQDQIRAYRIADNKVSESAWDVPLMLEELELTEALSYPWLDDLCNIAEETFTTQENEEVSFTPKNLRCPECNHEGPKKEFKIPVKKS